MEAIKINHGIADSGFFVIAQPKGAYNFVRFPEEGERIKVELTDKTGAKFMAELHDMWSVDEQNFDAMCSLSKLAYGVDSALLKPVLLKKYPQLRDDFKIEYWLMKKESK